MQNPFLYLGLGIALGVGSIYLLVDLLPILMLGGGIYLVYKGVIERKDDCEVEQ